MVIAEMETEHFSWLALREDEAQARGALLDAMRAHAAQTDPFTWSFGGMDPDPEAALEYYGANFFQIEPGQGLRDGSPIKQPAEDQVEYDRLIAKGWSKRDAARHVRLMFPEKA